ncbi:cupin domain-containing protein [Bradyrhizobium genosp. P]|uniref:cupin domain-containing protein n=1 Tax=Bradyrhizobium genosp. P TaxID=83641 RepID=UPI003CF83709
MIDPLPEVVTLLQPGAAFSKVVSGAGPWRVRRPDAGEPFYGVILEGSCRLGIEGHEPVNLVAGDFVLSWRDRGDASSAHSSGLTPG